MAGSPRFIAMAFSSTVGVTLAKMKIIKKTNHKFIKNKTKKLHRQWTWEQEALDREKDMKETVDNS